MQSKHLHTVSEYVRYRFFNRLEDDERLLRVQTVQDKLKVQEVLSMNALKGHLGLVEPYDWHKLSAKRQNDFLANLRHGALDYDTVLVQYDFKENERYPLARVETGDMWARPE